MNLRSRLQTYLAMQLANRLTSRMIITSLTETNGRGKKYYKSVTMDTTDFIHQCHLYFSQLFNVLKL